MKVDDKPNPALPVYKPQGERSAVEHLTTTWPQWLIDRWRQSSPPQGDAE